MWCWSSGNGAASWDSDLESPFSCCVGFIADAPDRSSLAVPTEDPRLANVVFMTRAIPRGPRAVAASVAGGLIAGASVALGPGSCSYLGTSQRLMPQALPFRVEVVT